jgi:hypothetical protein
MIKNFNTDKTGIISFRLSLLRKIPAVFFVFFMYFSASAQIKIFLETDLKGVSGVYKFAQTREKDTPANIQACEYFMGDLDAVVRGLRRALWGSSYH